MKNIRKKTSARRLPVKRILYLEKDVSKFVPYETWWTKVLPVLFFHCRDIHVAVMKIRSKPALAEHTGTAASRKISSLLKICFLAILLLAGCRKDFIEADLNGKLVSILAPADEDTVSTTTPLFWWNEIDGTRSYHIQLVYPHFYSPQVLLYDTLVEGDRFYANLNPGYTYYWRIRPENSSSHGEWVTRSLTIDSTVSLSVQSVVIISPASNGYSTSTSTVSFSWNGISGAIFYRIDITNTTNNTNVTSTTTTLNTFSYTFPQGNYSFSVRAENATSFTPWSVRTFSIDQTAPTAPQLISPANLSFYATPPPIVNFDWTSATDALTDSLYISTDSTFTTGIQAALLLNSSQSAYAWTGAQASTVYYWRVRSIDVAGNRSNYSSVFKFTDN